MHIKLIILDLEKKTLKQINPSTRRDKIRHFSLVIQKGNDHLGRRPSTDRTTDVAWSSSSIHKCHHAEPIASHDTWLSSPAIPLFSPIQPQKVYFMIISLFFLYIYYFGLFFPLLQCYCVQREWEAHSWQMMFYCVRHEREREEKEKSNKNNK